MKLLAFGIGIVELVIGVLELEIVAVLLWLSSKVIICKEVKLGEIWLL
jgi:type IV secretory pathway VirB3-like protein